MSEQDRMAVYAKSTDKFTFVLSRDGDYTGLIPSFRAGVNGRVHEGRTMDAREIADLIRVLVRELAFIADRERRS